MVTTSDGAPSSNPFEGVNRSLVIDAGFLHKAAVLRKATRPGACCKVLFLQRDKDLSEGAIEKTRPLPASERPRAKGTSNCRLIDGPS